MSLTVIGLQGVLYAYAGIDLIFGSFVLMSSLWILVTFHHPLPVEENIAGGDDNFFFDNQQPFWRAGDASWVYQILSVCRIPSIPGAVFSALLYFGGKQKSYQKCGVWLICTYIILAYHILSLFTDDDNLHAGRSFEGIEGLAFAGTAVYKGVEMGTVFYFMKMVSMTPESKRKPSHSLESGRTSLKIGRRNRVAPAKE